MELKVTSKSLKTAYRKYINYSEEYEATLRDKSVKIYDYIVGLMKYNKHEMTFHINIVDVARIYKLTQDDINYILNKFEVFGHLSIKASYEVDRNSTYLVIDNLLYETPF